jgi:hypothetical protein
MAREVSKAGTIEILGSVVGEIEGVRFCGLMVGGNGDCIALAFSLRFV